jgi:hypothetical protein
MGHKLYTSGGEPPRQWLCQECNPEQVIQLSLMEELMKSYTPD